MQSETPADSREALLTANPYQSVDPAPPYADDVDGKQKNVKALATVLRTQANDLWLRYRAMFALRNIGTKAVGFLPIF